MQRFNDHLWHDSKLRGMSVYRSDRREVVTLSVLLRQRDAPPVLVDVTFLQSVYCSCDLDLEGKRLCSDDIESASCNASSSWRDEIVRGHPGDSFDEYCHFNVNLIEPGGTIDVLAVDFEVRDSTR